MRRREAAEIEDWALRLHRKPLVVRGARQVGKTWLVRDLGRRKFAHYIEFNFDRTPEKADLFSADIRRTTALIGLDSGEPVVDGQTLLFLDEIQAVPRLFSLLRYFYEERPGLHVVAAGSLLEFMFAEQGLPMPVGRTEFMHLGPMQIRDVIAAVDGESLSALLDTDPFASPLPTSLHRRLMTLTRLYAAVGGMPAAVQRVVDRADLLEVTREHEGILQSYRDDFGRYRGRLDHGTVHRVFQSVPSQISNKLKYVNLSRDAKAATVASIVELLERARVLHSVCHSAGNGVPLGAEVKRRDRKLLFLDVGLACTALGVSLTTMERSTELNMVHRGAIAEQLIGQHLLYASPSYREPSLYYWNREKRGSSAELDYLIELDDQVVPVEVKAGKAGTLKSMFVFAKNKGARLALRFHSGPASLTHIKLSTATPSAELVLMSLPHYFVGEARRLLRSVR